MHSTVLVARRTASLKDTVNGLVGIVVARRKECIPDNPVCIIKNISSSCPVNTFVLAGNHIKQDCFESVNDVVHLHFTQVCAYPYLFVF